MATDTNPAYASVLKGLAGGASIAVDKNTGAKVVLPPADGITVQVPLTQVNPYVADVTRTNQARLGMIDLNPTVRISALWLKCTNTVLRVILLIKLGFMVRMSTARA